jgi:hypothetical protein
VAQVLYTVQTGATPTNSSGSIQTIIAVSNTGTDFGIQLKKFRIAFNGVTASNPPLPIRIYTTNGTAAGTAGTTPTVVQAAGRTLASTNIAGGAYYSAEPTTKAYFDEFLLTPNGGTVIYDFPLGDEPDTQLGGATAVVLGLELGAGTVVGVTGALYFTRI